MADNRDNNDLDAARRRIHEEFGPRRPRAGENDPPPPPSPDPVQPLYGEARPIPPQPEHVRLRLPSSPVRAAWVLLVINVLIYVLSGLLSILVTGNFNSLFNPHSGVLQLLGWKQNDLIAQGQYWRLLTAMFLHGNLIHIFFNGYALYILGPEAERIYGTSRFLALYFLAGLAGSVASYAFSRNPSVGASGAIFGLIGGLAAFYYGSRQILGDFGRSQLQNMIVIIVINLLIGFSAGGVIDNNAHIGGLVGGALAGLLLAPRYFIDQQLFPPVIIRRFYPWGWAGAIGMLLFLGILVMLIRPPL